MPLSKESFVFGHSLISNNFPKGVPLARLDELYNPDTIDIGRFGLFEVSSPNFNTYFPDVSAEDLQPKDEDFVYPIYRALSAAIINKYGPIDFGAKKDVLRNSMNKLIGQSVYNNHEAISGNELGVVKEVEWQNARKTKGVTIPAGFNARLMIDGKSNPKIARGAMMSPPAIHSTSVTVEFGWVPSHPKMERDEFFSKLGTLDEKGKLIKRNVDDVKAYYEISFVPHGADRYAQKVDKDGNINNPQHAADTQRFTLEDFKEMPHYWDFKDIKYYQVEGFKREPETSISTNSNKPNNNSNNSNKMDEQLLQFFRSTLGLADDATEEAILAKLQEQLPSLLEAQVNLETANAELQGMKDKYPEGTEILSKEDKDKLEKFDSVNAIATSALKSTREECEKLYKISCNNEVDAGILKLISESNWDTLLSLNKQYKKTTEEKFTASCNECGSTDITRASSQTGDGVATPGASGGSNGKSGNTQPINKDNAEVSESFKDNLRKASIASIHGEVSKDGEN